MKKSEQIIIESWETVNYSNIHLPFFCQRNMKEKRDRGMREKERRIKGEVCPEEKREGQISNLTMA